MVRFWGSFCKIHIWLEHVLKFDTAKVSAKIFRTVRFELTSVSVSLVETLRIANLGPGL